MASFHGPVGHHPLQIDPLRVLISDIQGELESDDRIQLLSLLKDNIGAAEYTRIRKEFKEEDGELRTIDVFDTLIEKIGQKKAIMLFINAFTLLERHMRHGQHKNKAIADILKEYLDSIKDHENKTGLKADRYFVGREEYTNKILQLFLSSDVKAVSVCGMRGIGKTSLAETVCYNMSSTHHYNVISVYLDGVDNIDLMMNKILERLNISPGHLLSTNDLKVQLITYLRSIEDETILLLDNIDDLCYTSAMQNFLNHLQDILYSMPDQKVKLLLTSTNKLVDWNCSQSNVIEKETVRFSGLLREIELEKLPVEYCVLILQRYTGLQVDKNYDVSPKELEELSVLCYQNPYLLTLMGKQLSNGDDQPKLLIKLLKSDDSALIRHLPRVEDVIKHAYESLDRRHQDVLLRLSVFLTFFDLPAAACVLRELSDTAESLLLENTDCYLRYLRSRHFVCIDDTHYVKDSSKGDTTRSKHVIFHVPALIRQFLKGVHKSGQMIIRMHQAENQLRCYYDSLIGRLAKNSENGGYARVIQEICYQYQHIHFALQDLSSINLPDITSKSEFLSALRKLSFLGTPVIYRKDEDRMNFFERLLTKARLDDNIMWGNLIRLFIAHQWYDCFDTVNGYKRADAILHEMKPAMEHMKSREDIGYTLLWAHYCYIQAQVLGFKEDYEAASKMIDTAMPLIRKHAGTCLYLVKIYHQIAFIADYRENLEKAKYYYDKSYEKAQKILKGSDHPELMDIIMNIGAFHHGEGRNAVNRGDNGDKHFDDATRWYNVALKTLRSLHMFYTSRSVNILMNITSLCLDKKAPGEALLTAIDAKELAEKFKMTDPIIRIRTAILLGRVFSNIARRKRQSGIPESQRFYHKAESEFDDALELCRKNRLVGKDIGKGDPENCVYWDDLRRFPKILGIIGNNAKSDKIANMLQRMENDLCIPTSDTDGNMSDSSDSEHAMNSVEHSPSSSSHSTNSKEGHESSAHPPLQKADSVDSAVPFKILRLSCGEDDGSSLL